MSEEYCRIEIRERVEIKPNFGEKICRVGTQWYRISHMSVSELAEHFSEQWPDEFRIYGPAGWQKYDQLRDIKKKVDE